MNRTIPSRAMRRLVGVLAVAAVALLGTAVPTSAQTDEPEPLAHCGLLDEADVAALFGGRASDGGDHAVYHSQYNNVHECRSLPSDRAQDETTAFVSVVVLEVDPDPSDPCPVYTSHHHTDGHQPAEGPWDLGCEWVHQGSTEAGEPDTYWLSVIANGHNYVFFFQNGAASSEALRTAGAQFVQRNVFPDGFPWVAVINDLAPACAHVAEEPSRFDDIADNHHAQAIDCIAEWGITNGADGDGRTFNPSGTVSRAQMASFVAAVLREAGIELPEPEGRFTDLEGNPHAEQIERLAAAGVVRGIGEGLYGPNMPVTRAQMATMIVQTYAIVTEGGVHPSGISGANVTLWGHYFDDTQATPGDVNMRPSAHLRAEHLVAELGIAHGVAERVYGGKHHMSRGQMASFLARTLALLVEEGHLTVEP